jgi:Micrococcal nuclease (thermonuclease) homologs
MRFYYTKLVSQFKNLTRFVLILFLLSCAQKEPAFYRVTEINDGDTITVAFKSKGIFPLRIEKIRLIGIDAPELGQKPWGQKAKEHLKKLIEESDYYVKIELDIQQRDKYGRLLAYLWDTKGRNINYMMIKEGIL